MTKGQITEAKAVALLEAMNGATKSASFGDLDRLCAETETLLEELQTLERPSLERIRRLADRNAACLEAAAQGLRAGRRRLAEIAAAGRADVYNRAGERRPLPSGVSGRRL